jgi:signal transduction histidine kinase
MQVWTNLVDNALGAMGESGVLTVETSDVGDCVEVRVGDTGFGIPDALRESVFDLDVTTRGPGAGLGLGLPICRSIIEKNHGGTITFESRPGRTEFVVTLPKTPPKGEEGS